MNYRVAFGFSRATRRRANTTTIRKSCAHSNESRSRPSGKLPGHGFPVTRYLLAAVAARRAATSCSASCACQRLRVPPAGTRVPGAALAPAGRMRARPGRGSVRGISTLGMGRRSATEQPAEQRRTARPGLAGWAGAALALRDTAQHLVDVLTTAGVGRFATATAGGRDYTCRTPSCCLVVESVAPRCGS